jgi:hypothetical protein
VLDDAVLVRAGEMRKGDVLRSAETSFERCGSYELSLWSFPGMSAHEVAREVGVVREETGLRLMPHPKMRHAAARDLRALGYEVESGGGPRGHVRLKLGAAPDDGMCATLDDAFAAPEDNPIALRSTQ